MTSAPIEITNRAFEFAQGLIDLGPAPHFGFARKVAYDQLWNASRRCQETGLPAGLSFELCRQHGQFDLLRLELGPSLTQHKDNLGSPASHEAIDFEQFLRVERVGSS